VHPSGLVQEVLGPYWNSPESCIPESVEDGGIKQDSSEIKADESISVEFLHLKRRMSQHIINKSTKKAKIAIHEESDNLGLNAM